MNKITKKLKVSISSKIIEGPYGGGNLFVKNLKNFLEQTGHTVINTLDENDIDIILIINPLFDSESFTYSHIDAYYYSLFINKNTKIVLRINECDERKNTNYVNNQILDASKYVDSKIFVSNWLQTLYSQKGISIKDSQVIMSGSDKEIFFSRNIDSFDKSQKVKLVTHHWSNHWNKGFEIYYKIDKLLSFPEWNNLFSFTYIGNVNKLVTFKNIHIKLPLEGNNLSRELRNYDGYITASINEPSGNHHIEAAQCGLPILYINSGGLPEYCKGFGIMFEINDFENKLKEFLNKNNLLKEKMKDYPFNSKKMCEEYLDAFYKILGDEKKTTNKKVSRKFVKLLSYKFKLKRFKSKLIRKIDYLLS